MSPGTAISCLIFFWLGNDADTAERTGRRFRGLNIDPAYVDVAIERWSARTGLEPRLEGLGS
jgi:hypothetical protein